MSFFSWILFFLIVACLAVILIIFFSKLASVSAVNLATAPSVKQVEVKKRLLEERLQRKFSHLAGQLAVWLKPVSQFLAARLKFFYRKIIELEEIYRHKILKSSFQDRVAKERYASEMLKEAALLAVEEKFAAAEKKYIEILNLDEKNLEAYRGLGELYLRQKDYEHAKETFEFLLKLNAGDPVAYRRLGETDYLKGDLKAAQERYLKSLELDAGSLETCLALAEICLNLEEPSQAFKYALQASILEPHHPRVLDFLIEVSIIVRDKSAALKAYKQLKEVNPENQKLAELKEKIDKL